jgi:hypothetical protein
MFLIIGLVLLGVWLVGFGLFRAVVGGMIHVVLIIALFALAWHFLAHSSRATGGSTSADARLRRVGVSAPALAGHVRYGVVVT